VVGRAGFVTDDRLVVQAAEGGGDTGVWTVGIDGREPEELYAPGACNVQVGHVDPAGTRLAVSQACDLAIDSGVVVVDLATGDRARGAAPLVAGRAVAGVRPDRSGRTGADGRVGRPGRRHRPAAGRGGVRLVPRRAAVGVRRVGVGGR
jgi:hypothetical protein